MQQADWFYKNDTAPAAYSDSGSKLEFQFRAGSMLIKATGGPLTFSFDGKDDHGLVDPADGLVPFNGTDKGTMWVRGGNGYVIMAWSAATP